MKDLNKYILLVMKRSNDKDSVTQQELVAYADAAYAAADYAAYAAAAHAAAAADADADAEKWVNKYFERTDDNKQDYIDALSGDVKTTMDAVNEFKGEWANAKYGDIDVKFIFVSKGEGSTWPKGMLVGDHENNSPSVFDEVCTREGFNTLVDHLASNMGRATQTYAEHKKEHESMEIDWSKAPEYYDYHLSYNVNPNNKGFCCIGANGGYYFLNGDSAVNADDWTITKRPNPEAAPVYTQEMADNGVLPSVGMEYLCEDGQLNECLANVGGKAIGIMLEHVPVNGVLPISQSSIKYIKPIDNRTYKEKAIDEAYKELILASGKSNFKNELGNIYDKWVK